MVPHLLIRYFFTDLMRCRKSTIAHLLVTAPQAAGLLGQVGTTRTLPASPPPAHMRCRFAIEFYLSHSPPPQAVGQPATSRASDRSSLLIWTHLSFYPLINQRFVVILAE